MNIRKFTEKHYISIFFFIILIVIIVGGIFMSDPASADQSSLANQNLPFLMASMKIHQINDPASSPDFSLMSLDGKPVNLSEFDGKVVLLSFWATW